MKTIASALIMLISLETSAFNESINRNLHMPTNGFWVVEKNPEKEQTFVHFYDHNKKLLHSETVKVRSEKFLKNSNKRKFNKKLNEVLSKEIVGSKNQVVSSNK
jgi:hypothetical protein